MYYSWSQISTGGGLAAGITSDGMLWTWGAGASGQLGNNSTISASKPTMVGNSSWTSVSAGKNPPTTNHMAAIRIDGGLFVWGNNANGGLGLGDTVTRSSPTQVGTSSWIAVSAGFDNNIFAVRVDGALFTWGTNTIYGVLGQNNINTSKSSPVQVGTSSWITVSAGSFSAAAIRSDGGLFTWGANGVGQLGSGTLVHRSSPVQVGTSSWTQVSAGASSIAAIRSDGGLFTWGAGNYGGLGSNATLNRSSPVQVGTSSWVQVNASIFNMNARRVDGAVFSWGYNTGQIGDNTSVDRSSPVQLAAGSSYSVVGLGAAALATASAMFIRSDGRLFTAGNNLYGQLGIKTQGSASSPVAVSTINDSWAVVSTGNGVTAAIRNDNLLFMWGLGTGGALGANISTSRSSPVQIGTSSWSMVNAGSATLGRRVDGALFAWGLNTNGTVGDNTFINRSSPVQLGTNSWSMIAGSGLTSSAIRNDGILFLWGTGTQGQMGNYRFINYNSPIQLATMNDSWSVVSAGSSYMTAIRSDKLLFTWGLGTVGRLGDGTTITKSAPVQIGNSSWTSVSAGNDTTIAIRADNTLFTWGQGGSGQLGDGTLISKSSPIQIGTGSWGKISAGESFFGAIGNDGGLYMTGLNDVTQLGIVRNGNQSSPVLVKSVTDTWYKTSASNKDIFAIRSDKLLFGWGQNLQGMLGLGDAGIARSAPVQIGSSSWAQVSAGTSHTAALQYDGSLFVWGLGTSGQLGDSTIVSKSSPVQIGVAVPEGYYSVLFNGTTDYLQIANNVAFNFGTGDFTGECWFNLTADAATDGANQKIAYLFGPGQSVTSEAWFLAIRGNSTTTGTGLTFQSRNTSGTPTSLDATYTFSKNTWYHVAVSKSGSTLALFINGEKIAEDTSWTVTSNSGTSPFRIARRGVSANYEQYFPGYISNLRVLKGTGLYTSSFTPEGPLTAITDTQLLTCQSAAIKDNSTNSFTITTFGSTRTSTSSPFNSSTSLTGWYDVSAGNNFTMAIDSKYNLYAWGDNTYTQLGIVRYNGTSSPVIVKGINDNWKDVSVGSGQTGAIRSDDTLYTWGLGTSGQLGDSTIVSKSTPVQIGLNTPPDGYYSVSFNGTSNYLEIANSTNLILGTGDFTIEAWIYQTAWGKNRAIYSKTGTTVSSGTMFFGIDISGKIIVELNSTTIFSGVNTIPLNTWTHVAWSRNSGTSYYFVNGNLDGSVSDTSDFFGTGASRIGLGRGNSTTFWSGQISNLRVLKGTGLYTSSFTPEGPLTAITNTQLLTCQSTTIKDNSINKFTITNN